MEGRKQEQARQQEHLGRRHMTERLRDVMHGRRERSSEQEKRHISTSVRLRPPISALDPAVLESWLLPAAPR